MVASNHAYAHILVTDSSAPGQSPLGLLLATVGYRVTCVRDSIEAAGVLRATPVDIAITEVNTGDAVEQGMLVMVRKFFPDLPVIACVGNLGVAQRATHQQLGVAVVLAKPVDPRVLLDCVKRVLNARTEPRTRGTTTASAWLAGVAGRTGSEEAAAPIQVGHSPQARQLNADFARLRGFASLALLEGPLGLGALDLAMGLARPEQALVVACLAGWLDRAVLTELLAPAQEDRRPVVLVVLESEQLDASRQALVEALLSRQEDDALSERFAGRVRVLLCAAVSLSDRAEQGHFSERLLMRAGPMVQQVPSLAGRGADLWWMALAIWTRTGHGAVPIDPDCEAWIRARAWPGDYPQFHRTIEIAGRLVADTGGPLKPGELARAARIEPSWDKALWHESLMTACAGPLVVWD